MTPRRYSFDPQRCCVWVNARSSVHPINTETRGLGGWVELAVAADGSLDMGVEVTGRLELSVDRLSSGNVLYDRELKRRIDARKYPLIEGQITRVQPASAPGLYLVTGDLTFHGRTRTFENEMTITAPDDRSISLTGEYVFDIREFNMKPPSMLMLKVYPEVGVRVELFGTISA
ncbi:MAG TPA: YceI family protein [Acidimicrobiales bacterium]|nr:YceI family protein [Acidimicrobiales bacterium]